MNQVGLVGRVTKDPEVKYYNDKRPYTMFTLAISRPFKNQDGEYEADFVQCSAWGKLAEHVSKYCGKGSLIGVNGRLNSRSYTNRDNEKVFTLDVTAETIRFYSLKERSQVMDLSNLVQSNEGQEKTSQNLEHASA